MTTDIDAVIQAASVMKDVINRVGDRYDLPNGWLNQDFVRTESYSPSLSRFSEYYKTYSNVLTIRTVAAEYLIAMKLRSGRQYKSDLSDVLGILAEHEKKLHRLHWSRFRKLLLISTEIGIPCRKHRGTLFPTLCGTVISVNCMRRRSSGKRKRKSF